MAAERVQKILARAGLASRRKAEELIRQGRVTVNGRPAEVGDKADPETDAIKVDGRRVRPPRGHRYLLLNKPRGCLSTRSDPEGRPTVLDLLPPGLRKALFTVGRLDGESEGLLILTDDGDFAQRVAHPRYGCRKRYAVKVKGLPDEAAIGRLRKGIVLEGKRTAAARIRLARAPRAERQEANSWWTVELSEGRTRQIREMFERIGHPVLRLRRQAIGAVTDRGLPLGAYRELSRSEIDSLRTGESGRHRGRGRSRRPARPRRRGGGGEESAG